MSAPGSVKRSFHGERRDGCVGGDSQSRRAEMSTRANV